MSRSQCEMDLACMRLVEAMAHGQARKPSSQDKQVIIERKGRTLLVKREIAR